MRKKLALTIFSSLAILSGNSSATPDAYLPLEGFSLINLLGGIEFPPRPEAAEENTTAITSGLIRPRDRAETRRTIAAINDQLIAINRAIENLLNRQRERNTRTEELHQEVTAIHGTVMTLDRSIMELNEQRVLDGDDFQDLRLQIIEPLSDIAYFYSGIGYLREAAQTWENIINRIPDSADNEIGYNHLRVTALVEIARCYRGANNQARYNNAVLNLRTLLTALAAETTAYRGRRTALHWENLAKAYEETARADEPINNLQQARAAYEQLAIAASRSGRRRMADWAREEIQRIGEELARLQEGSITTRT